MAKQRLVDFRGGVNKKISPHMIGDSQGQDAQDVDLSSVRLQGRKRFDNSDVAEGSFYYEPGNLANEFGQGDGRWVSIYPEDGDAYLAGAEDFALWNKDLYVAYGENSVNGELQVYRDGSTSASQLNFDAPGTTTYTTFSAEVRSGTYSQSGTSLTLTFTADPNLAVGDTITVDFTPSNASRVAETLVVATINSLVVTATSKSDVGTSAQTGDFDLLDALVHFSLDDVSEVLIDTVAGIAYVAPVSGAHPVTDTGQVDESVNVKNYIYTKFTTNPYSLVGQNSDHNNKVEYTQTVNGVTTSYFENNDSNSSSYKRLQYVSGGSGPITYSAVSLTTSNATSAGYTKNTGSTRLVGGSNSNSGTTYYQWDRPSNIDTSIYGTVSDNTTPLWAANSGALYTLAGGPVTNQYSLNNTYWYFAGGPQTQSISDTHNWFYGSTDTEVSENRNDANNYWDETVTVGTTGINQSVGVTTYLSKYTPVSPSSGSAQTSTSSSSWTAADGLSISKNTSSSNLTSTDYDDTTSGWYWQVTGPSNGFYWVYVKTNSGLVRASSAHTSYNSAISVTSVSNSSGTATYYRGSSYATNSYRLQYTVNVTRYPIDVNGTISVTELEVKYGNTVVYTQSPASSNPTSVTGSDSKTYTRTGTADSNNRYQVIQQNPYTLSVYWGGSAVYSNSNVSSSISSINAGNFTYTKGSAVSATTNPDGVNVGEFRVSRNDPWTTVTNPTWTQATTPASWTYADHTDTIPAITGKPETPAFTYDKARTKLYKEYNATSDVGSETTDNAEGYEWLSNRDFSLADSGYYLATLREDPVTNLPLLSSDTELATLATGSYHVFGESTLDSSPQRLNFSITAPTDNPGSTFKGYKLTRKDSFGTYDLGYIAPDSNVSFSYDSTTKAVTISGLGTTSSDNYRLKFTAYQDTQVRTTLNSGTPVTAKSNMSGVLFNGNDTFTIQLIDGTDTRFRAADFWLEEKIIDGTSSTSDDIYAIIRCYDLFDRNGNAIQSGVIEGTCDFLDAFKNGISSGGLTSGTTQSGAPTYLKFLKESNNFFFAVGTDSTPDNRYGSATNKSDSFLFVSEYNNPRSWPITGYVEFEGSITGLASYPGELIAWTSSGTFRVTGSRYDQMRKTKLATTEGMPIGQHRTIAQVGSYLVWVSQSGICFYDGERVTNLTRGRYPTWTFQGSSLHAGQFDDTYYVVGSNETGYSVDFSLEGFPVSEVDLKEGSTTTPTNTDTTSTQYGETLPPVLVYRPSVNKLFSRRGIIEGANTRNTWTFKTREFDGGSFGSLKLVRNVTLNGTGSGKVQVYLDGKPAFFGILPNPPFEYDFADQTYLKKSYTYNSLNNQESSSYQLYYRGVLITTAGPSKTEGTDWVSNDSTYNFTFASNHTVADYSENTTYYTSPTYYYIFTSESYYPVRNNLLVGATPKSIQITSSIRTEPARIYLPAASADTQYGLNMADVWSVEITEWDGQIDWIDTEYEIISGG